MIIVGKSEGIALLFEDQHDLEIVIKNLQDHLTWRKENKKPLQKSIYMDICPCAVDKNDADDIFQETCNLFDI